MYFYFSQIFIAGLCNIVSSLFLQCGITTLTLKVSLLLSPLPKRKPCRIGCPSTPSPWLSISSRSDKTPLTRGDPSSSRLLRCVSCLWNSTLGGIKMFKLSTFIMDPSQSVTIAHANGFQGFLKAKRVKIPHKDKWNRTPC